jgi:hypothetical protein
MIPTTFDNFFLATAGAGAGLIGLLFVAISVNPERVLGAEGQPEHQAMAESTFTALVNGFFLSCAALIPVGGIGYAGMVFATLGLVGTGRLAFRLTRAHYSATASRKAWWMRLLRISFMNVVSLALYGYEFFNSSQLIRPPVSTDNLVALCDILLAIYGVALIRAWALLGARRGGLTGWLNPLIDLPPPQPAKATEQEQEQEQEQERQPANSNG